MRWFKISIIAAAAAYLVLRSTRRGPGQRPSSRTPAGDTRWQSALSGVAGAMARHRIMAREVAAAYRERQDPKRKAAFYRYARWHMDAVQETADELRNANGGVMPGIPTFKYLAMVLESDGRFADAIQVCEEALALGLKDGTKTGFEGRIARLRKKMA